MDKCTTGKKIFSQPLAIVMLTGCVATDVPSGQRADAISGTTGGGPNTGGSGATGSDGIEDGETSILPKIEIRHLIEPNLSNDPNYSTGTGIAGGGSYVRKLTIPKNFAGRLYVAGINIPTLSNKHVRVRFKFGMNREPVTIPATVTYAPGITPDTNIGVLVMDLRSEPFRNIRLLYDLFDYNDYNFNAGDVPTQDNRNTGLYCRGLRIEDDPTFDGVGSCDGIQSNPSQPEEECLYAYAKVLDQGLIQQSGAVKVPITPSLSQTKSMAGSFYFQDYLSYQLKKPLPDTMPTTAPFIAGNYKFSENSTTGTDSTNITFTYPTSIWDPITILGTQYYYRGPYRLVDTLGWQFKYADLDGEKRLFRKNSWVDYPIYLTSPLPDDNQASPVQNKLYYNSYLFPLATKLNLNANVAHLASNDVIGTRSEQALSSSGQSLWMDGSNARAQSRNSDLEHIGSCNISASIEILAKDDNNNDFVIALSKEVKLQLVRPSQYKTDTGNEVLYTNFKSCTSNASCGGSECCFNNRCWDENLVSQCFDSSNIQGNRIVGESCNTDLECTSLCCNRTTGQCAPHNSIVSPAVLCNKPIGDFCIAKEWCQKSAVTKCLIIKTGTDNSGNVTCRQQCYVTQEFGDCKNGVCVAPVQETITPFDPDAEGACVNAVPAPNF